MSVSNSVRVEAAFVLVLAASLVALGAVSGAGAPGEDDVRLSTYRNGRRGMRALHLVLEAMGERPSRLLHAPTPEDDRDRTLVVAAPSHPVTRREAAGMLEWAAVGGRLVVIADAAPQRGASAILDVLGVSIEPTADPGAIRVEDAGLGADLGTIEWRAAQTLQVDSKRRGGESAATLVSCDAGPLVVRVPHGDADVGGEVVVVADRTLFENERLGEADGAVLAARLLLLRDSDEGRVVFDEFHHGFEGEGGTSHLIAALLGMLLETWPGRAVLIVALAGALHLLGRAVRFGRPDPDSIEARRSLVEHADALGRLLETARARREALSILVAGARRVAGRRAGFEANLSPAQFAAALRASSAPHAGALAAAIEAASAPGAVKDSRLAELAANLAAAKRRYLHGGR
jgi:hypothetical protein